MGENKKADKILLYYNPHSGSGVFKNNLESKRSQTKVINPSS